MASFAAAIPETLRFEGGYVDDPADPGGATDYGISLRFLKGELLDLDHDGDVDADDVRGLTPEAASEIYRHFFWDRFGYGRIADQRVANKVFDAGVNIGPPRAIRLLQRSLCACGHPVEVDGSFGDKTLAAVNGSDPVRLLREMCQEHATYYRTLVELKPQLGKFLKGWLRRAHYCWPEES